MDQKSEALKNGISLVCLDEYADINGSVELMQNEIKGAELTYHVLKKDQDIKMGKCNDKLRTFLIIEGRMTAENGLSIMELNTKDTYVSDLAHEVTLTAVTDARILEIRKYIGDEMEIPKEEKTQLPIRQGYDDCSQYREDFKSKKSISRSMIDHHILPGFCMGSNESYGPDIVEKHMHPLLDQFFYSFDDNDVNLMIDDMIQPYKANTVIHIPLGSDHGVDIPAGGKMHYVWMDFMVDQKSAIAYLDEVHKKTGVHEVFDENGNITK